MYMARPAAPFVLTLADAEILQGWLRMTSLPQSLAQRARILLRLADGQSPKEISEQLQVSAPVVFKWRKRYQEAGLEGLNDLPRSGQPRKLDEAKIKEILTLTTQRVPREATHWSLRLMVIICEKSSCTPFLLNSLRAMAATASSFCFSRCPS